MDSQEELIGVVTEPSHRLHKHETHKDSCLAVNKQVRLKMKKGNALPQRPYTNIPEPKRSSICHLEIMSAWFRGVENSCQSTIDRKDDTVIDRVHHGKKSTCPRSMAVESDKGLVSEIRCPQEDVVSATEKPQKRKAGV